PPLARQRPNIAGPGLETSYPQVFANTADISGGVIEIRPSTLNGLYANDYFYDNVIDANTLTGTLGPASVGGDDGTDGVYAASILLDASPVYDGADNVDINVNRVAFNDPRFGLTPNQAQ